MDASTFMMIRLATFAALVALWLVAIGVRAYFRRRTSPTSPSTMHDGAARGPAANAASGPDTLRDAA